MIDAVRMVKAKSQFRVQIHGSYIMALQTGAYQIAPLARICQHIQEQMLSYFHVPVFSINNQKT